MLTQSIGTSGSNDGLELAHDETSSAPSRSLSSTFTDWLVGPNAADRIGAALRHLDSSLARQANAATSVLSMIRNRYEDRRRWRAYQRNIARWKLAGV